MGQEDRDWYRKEQERRNKLVWNDQRGEIELEKRPRWRRLPLTPLWLRETFRLLGYLAATLAAAWVLLYLVAPMLTG